MPKFMPDFSAINQQISNMEDEQKKVDECLYVILLLERITDRLETIINQNFNMMQPPFNEDNYESTYYEDLNSK